MAPLPAPLIHLQLASRGSERAHHSEADWLVVARVRHKLDEPMTALVGIQLLVMSYYELSLAMKRFCTTFRD